MTSMHCSNAGEEPEDESQWCSYIRACTGLYPGKSRLCPGKRATEPHPLQPLFSFWSKDMPMGKKNLKIANFIALLHYVAIMHSI